MYCSTSTLSDTGSWDTDFDDDQNSESSGFYGDVGPTLAEKPDLEVQTKSAGQGRVAALAKTVAASLAASGHSGMKVISIHVRSVIYCGGSFLLAFNTYYNFVFLSLFVFSLKF